MLTQSHTLEDLTRSLIPRESWNPFPTADDRTAWDTALPQIREATLKGGKEYLGHEWPALPASLFLEFARNGNRRNYEDVSFGRRYALRDLVLAECVDARGRFLDDIVNGIWAICEESFWGIPACMHMQEQGPGLPDVEEPVVPLFVAETVSLLAWTVYLIGPRLDQVSPLVIPRIKSESQRRVLKPLLDRDDFWWMGLQGSIHPITGEKRRVNNWNPWICSNWMTAALILEDNPDTRTQHIYKAMRCIDEFVDPYPRDGGCDEGPSYWGHAGASLFDCLELLHSATDGAIDHYGESVIQEIGRFIYRAQISDRWFTNFADASALVLPSSTICYLYGKRIADEHLMDIGAWSAHKRTEGWSVQNLSRGLPAIFAAPEILDREPKQPLPRDVWLPDIEVMISRDSEGVSDGLFVAAKGGHNDESHNHNDIGTFTVYTDGKPLLVDAGVETYTAKTFSPDRYDIWTMQTAHHNLPTFNGAQQEAGRIFEAANVTYASDNSQTSMSLDIHGAYPDDCGLESWRRTITHTRHAKVVIDDVYCFASVPTELSWHLMTRSDIEILEDGRIRLIPVAIVDGLVSGEGWLQFDPDLMDVSEEKIPVNDQRMSLFWGDHLNHMTLTARSPEASGSFSLTVTESE
jgi:hypothetical protein